MNTSASRSALVQLHAAAGARVETHNLTPRMGRAVTLAVDVGAPLVPTIDAVVAAEDDHTSLEQAVAVATSQARAVATGLAFAPVVLVPLLGRISGTDMATFYRTPAGGLVLVVGVSLILAGVAVLRVLVRRAQHGEHHAGSAAPIVATLIASLLFNLPFAIFVGLGAYVFARRRAGAAAAAFSDEAIELVAIALDGGCTPASAARMAAAHCPQSATRLRRLALDLEHGGASASTARIDDDPLRVLLATAQRVGAPAVPAIRAHARRLRAAQRAARLERVEQLPAQLTFPTALMFLPGTVLLVGAPIVAEGVTPLLS